MAKSKNKTLAKTFAKMDRERGKVKKQREDALGLSGESAGKFWNYRTLIRVKLVLLVLLPLAFFLCSPLLLPICLLYAGTFFVAKRFEKNANKGLRKSLWISIPRFDACVAVVLVCIVLFGVTLTLAASSEKASEFAGKNQTEIRRILENKGVSQENSKRAAQGIADNGYTLTRGTQLALQLSTVFTGERLLFMSKNGAVVGFSGESSDAQINKSGNNSGGGGTMVIKGADGNTTSIDLGTKGGISDIPFVNTLSAVIVVVNMLVLLVVFAGGIYTLRKMKRVEI